MKKFFCLVFLSSLYLNQINSQEISKADAFQLVFGNNKESQELPSFSAAYKDASTGLKYFYFNQQFQKIKVYNTVRNFVFSNQNVLLHQTGNFVINLSDKVKNTTPTILPYDAVLKTLQYLNININEALLLVNNTFLLNNTLQFSIPSIAKKNVSVELVYISNDDGKTVQLCWNVNINLKQSPNWWNVQIDAISGQYLSKDNWVLQCNFENHSNSCRHDNKFNLKRCEKSFSPLPPPLVTAANYKVIPLPFESPNHGSVAIETNPWLKAGVGNSAITHGWHFDGVENYDFTRGNNVFAYEDTADLDLPGASATSSTLYPNLNFLATPNFSQSPLTNLNQQFNITNLFYWNNVIHDVLYQYGFTEVAGNFQQDNIERGGLGNDFVVAEAQDGGGTNNANFGTPPDGDNGAMQMFLWSGTSGLVVTSPASIVGNYGSVESGLSNNNKLQNVGSKSGEVVMFSDDVSNSSNLGCDGQSANSLVGKIAFIYRGNCAFTVKIKNAQLSGAIAVIMVNNVSGSPITMGGADNTITIPAVMISEADGIIIANRLIAGNIVNATLNAGVDIDGDVDNGIVSHEYGHGVSNRFTGGPANASCLNNAEQGGEGWSDFIGLMLTTNWATTLVTDGVKPRGIGTYAIGETINGVGIRAYPYSTDFNINPLVYDNMSSNGAVHFIGTIWCSALWDMTWNMILMDGITPSIYNANSVSGNARAFKLVMEGMRLQTCRPGFLDARNAILAADSILYNGRYKCAIWNAFARRGMGFSASQGSSGSTSDQNPDYDVPSGVILTRNSTPIVVNSNQQTTINITASCQCEIPLNSFSIKDTIPSGFNYVSNNGGGTVSGNIVSFDNINFTATQQQKNYSVTLLATNIGCIIDTAINDNRESNTKGGFVSSSLSGANSWVTSNTKSKSGANSWLVRNLSSLSNTALASSSFLTKPLSILSFVHHFTIENLLDGGLVETSINNGTSWQNAANLFLQNPYTATMATGAAFTGKGFSGVSYDKFMPSMINLSAFNGSSTRVRFRLATTSSNAGSSSYAGWFIDDVVGLNGCGSINKIGLYNNSNQLIDDISIPLFVRPASLPLTLTEFDVTGYKQDAILNWKTTNEVNVSYFEIQKSIDAVEFKSIGKVEAKNNLSANTYTFSDTKVAGLLSYYKLKIFDKDGSFKLSEIKVLQAKSIEGKIFISPNPAKNVIQLSFPTSTKKRELIIYNGLGKMQLQNSISANINQLFLNINSLAKGMYSVILVNREGEQIITKLVVE